MVYVLEEPIPTTNSNCCSSRIRCERCINEAETRLGRRLNKRLARGMSGLPPTEPVYNLNSRFGDMNMYFPSQPAGGQLGLPEIKWGSGHTTHRQSVVGRSSAVFNSFGEGPVGGPLGLPEQIWNEQPQSAKPCRCHVQNNYDADGPAGGQLGQPEIVW
jgi:hypothetical protein